MRKICIVILVTGIVLLIGMNNSWSQKSASKAGSSQKWFNEIDTDGDGKISRDEHMKHSEKRAESNFREMDVNKDGFVSEEEFKEGVAKKRNKRKTKQQPVGEKK